MDHYTPQSFKDYLEIFFRRRTLFAVPFMLVLLATAGFYPFLPRLYQSSSLILVEEDEIINPLIEGLAVKATIEKRLKTLSSQILSWTNMTRLTQRMGLAEKISDQKEYEKLIDSMSDRISIRMVSEKVIRIAYEDKDPQLAWKVTAALSEDLTERNRRQKQLEAKSAIEFIEQQLRVYKEKLQGSESSFFLNKVNKELAEAQKQRTLLQDQLDRMEKTVVTEVIRGQDPETQDLRRELMQSESLLQQMITDGSTDNRLLIPLQDKISNLRKRIRYAEESHGGTETTSANPAYQETLRRLKELDLTISSLEKRREELQKGSGTPVRVTEQDLLAMERDKRVNEDIYKSLLMRLENAHISQNLDAHGYGKAFQIIDPARLPLFPVKPQLHVAVAAGLAIAFIMGGGIVFLREFLDSSVRGFSDAKAYFPIPLLAAIPKLVGSTGNGDIFAWNQARKNDETEPRTGLRGVLRQFRQMVKKPKPHYVVQTKGKIISPYIVTYHQPDSIAGEQYRLLRTQLWLSNEKERCQTILVSSALAGEGKTSVAANLAISVAQEIGQKTLLLDCDLRKGALAKCFRTTQDKGLSELLTAAAGSENPSPEGWAQKAHSTNALPPAAIEPFLKDLSIPRLSLITSGKTVSDASKLFILPRMSEIMDTLRSMFQFIVMDCPPFTNLADVHVLTTHADGLLLVIRTGRTPRVLIKNLVEKMKNLGRPPIIGYVLNHMEQHLPIYFQEQFGEAYHAY